MITEPFQPPPVALELPDVQLWNVYWGQLERRIAPIFARSDARERAMAYLAACSPQLNARIAGNSPSKVATQIRMAFSICSAVPTGTPMRCVRGCESM